MINSEFHLGLISTSFPQTANGSEAAGSFVVDFADELSKHIQLSILAPGLSEYNEKRNNCKVYRFKSPEKPLSTLSLFSPRDIYSIMQTLHSGQKALKNAHCEKPFDYILALWSLPSGYWAKKLSEKHDIPYSTWSLGSDIWSLGKIPVIRSTLKKVLTSSHINFADGYVLGKDVEVLSGKPCQFMPSTRTMSKLSKKQLSSKPPYKLAFLGRWHPNKGIDILLNSLNLLGPSDWQYIEEIQICGGGILEKEVKLKVTKLKSLGYPITLKGYLDKQQALELFLWADYVLIPSRIESIPVVFSDAMKCHCPIISMPVGDLPILVKKYQIGELSSNIYPQDYADAIHCALQNSPKTYEKNLLTAAKDFDQSTIVNNFLKLINIHA